MAELKLAGRTAIVTGSGQNIGRAIAILFARAGAAVVVNGHANRDRVDSVVSEIRDAGGKALGIMADVGDPDQVEAMVRQATEAFGTVDILVNNVGRRMKQHFEEISIQDWQDTINNNLSSCFYTAHFAVPMMRERKWGRIINISGYDGFTGHIPQRAHNVTAKAGMHGLTKALARDLGAHNITANTVVPGAIDTVRDWSQYTHTQIEDALAKIPLKRLGDSTDIAEACLFLAGESGQYVSGQAIHVNGGEYMF